MTTLILSDIHLGSRSSQASLLSHFLRETAFDRLILNGDTLNDLNLKKLKPKHWRLFDQLRDVARRRELVLIRGNHDVKAGEEGVFGPGDVLATLLGVPLREQYPLEVGGRRYLVLHGDLFDPTLHWPILTDAADWCYRAVQEVNKKAAKWLKRRVKKLGGVVEFVKRRSVQYAKGQGYQGVITGHTHFCDDEWMDGVHFVNSGCWVDHPCTFVLARDGQVKLYHYDEFLRPPADQGPRPPARAETLLLGETLVLSPNALGAELATASPR
jgi:UDP-2,3-diacylglucosamine pyrophosphatase LpxH